MKHVRIAFLAVVLGLFLMWPLSLLFDKMGWPLFHSWGLIHGSFIIAWPCLSMMSFGAIEGGILLRNKYRNERTIETD